MYGDLSITWGLEVWQGLDVNPNWWEDDEYYDDHVSNRKRPKLRANLVIRKKSSESSHDS